MLNRIFLALLFVSLYSSGSSLNCRWMQDKFKEHNEQMLDLLDTMANNSTNTTEDSEGENSVAFPHKLYRHASSASATDKLAFVVQILEETAALFEEDHSAAPWENSTVDTFLIVLNRQADELSSCIGSHKKKNTKLHMYFKRLSGHILKKMGHSAEAWEMIRTEIEFHVMRAHQLASSSRTANENLSVT